MAKIMLVEDDNNLREIYEARLLAEGYEIVAAKDGEEALALAVKERPDLIISDVMMPKISGFDMLDILRGTPETKDTKVIMMTALSQAEDKARADKLGADRYLVKSQVTLEDVAKVAREVLEGEDTPMLDPAPAYAPAPSADDTDGAAPTAVSTDTPATAPPPANNDPAPAAAADEPAQTPANVPIAEPPADDAAPSGSFSAPLGTQAVSQLGQASDDEQAAIDDKIQEFVEQPPAKENEEVTAPAPDAAMQPSPAGESETPVAPSAPTADIPLPAPEMPATELHQPPAETTPAEEAQSPKDEKADSKAADGSTPNPHDIAL